MCVIQVWNDGRLTSVDSYPRALANALPLNMKPEHITLEEFWYASAQAAQNGVDKPKFRKLVKELESLPKTQERLFFQLLETLEKDPEATCDFPLIAQLRIWRRKVESKRLLLSVPRIERLLIRHFDNLPQIRDSEACLSIPMLLSLVQEADPSRLADIIAVLKAKKVEPGDPRHQIVSNFEDSLGEAL